MTAELQAARDALAKLTTKLDRIKLAGERIEAIYLRAGQRGLGDVHSHEARALAENCRIITHELHDTGGRFAKSLPTLTNEPGPFWTGDKTK